MSRPMLFMLVCFGALCGCSSKTDLSSIAPYNRYAGKTVALVSPMPVEYDLRKQAPSKVVPAGQLVSIRNVFIEKSYIKGPIIPGVQVSTRIFAIVNYRDPATGRIVTWDYPLGTKTSPYGYEEYILAAPWEPGCTPSLRFVGKDGKAMTE